MRTPPLDLASPSPVQLARNKDPTSLTFLLQSRLCSRAAGMALSWGRHKELTVFVSVYPHQVSITRRSQVKYHSHTVEGKAISAKLRSLTHSSLFLPPPHSALLEKANILASTGSFSSAQQSLQLVRVVALGGIETIIRLCVRV
jgi:hypothetical protein